MLQQVVRRRRFKLFIVILLAAAIIWGIPIAIQHQIDNWYDHHSNPWDR